MGASIARVKQHMRSQKGGVLYRVCYCALLFPLQKRQPGHREHFPLHKNTTAEDLGAQELQNPSQAKDPA